MESTPVVERLRLYRLKNNLTFDQLADQMRVAGCSVHSRNLHRLLMNHLQTGPRETTMFKVERFVALMRRRRRKARR